MKILQAHDQYGWITAIIEGRWVQAKVYDETSCYGINDGRVSKLSIGKTDSRDPTSNFFDQMDYHYDRGLDFKRRTLPIATLRKIVAQLEALPKLELQDE
jgi:hypothetical protein